MNLYKNKTGKRNLTHSITKLTNHTKTSHTKPNDALLSNESLLMSVGSYVKLG